MKKNILLGAVFATIAATTLGVSAVLVQGNVTSELEAMNTILTAAKLYQLAAISGLLSMSLFLIGWVTPANSK